MAIAESTETVIADHRGAALTALTPFAEKLNDIWGESNTLDPDAWDLIGIAGAKAGEVVENCIKEMPHAGALHCRVREIVSLCRGAELVLEHLGEKRSLEDEGALAILSKGRPAINDFAEALDRQSLRERGSLR